MRRLTDEKNLLVFHFFKKLAYPGRLLIAMALFAGGFILQSRSGEFLGGAALLFAGTLLLTVKGYDSRVNFRSFDPAAAWEETGMDKLDELIAMHGRIRNWDRTAFDASNALGCLTLGLVFFGLLVFPLGLIDDETTGLLLLGDALLLVVPHWLTGMRRVLTQPRLRLQAELVKRVLGLVGEHHPDLKISLQFCMHGKEHRIPRDVKFRLDTPIPHEACLGLYGQTVMNEVQGSSYPYFYMVLVARPGAGLKKIHDRYEPPRGLVKEWEDSKGVDVLILRQYTTSTSGYHTKPPTVDLILAEGITLLRLFTERETGKRKKSPA